MPETAATYEPEAAVGVKRSPWRDAWRRLNQDRLAMVSLVIVVIYALVGLLAEVGLIGADALPELGPLVEGATANDDLDVALAALV